MGDGGCLVVVWWLFGGCLVVFWWLIRNVGRRRKKMVDRMWKMMKEEDGEGE